jgi:hypothetical protein
MPVRCAFWSNSGQAAAGCPVAEPTGVDARPGAPAGWLVAEPTGVDARAGASAVASALAVGAALAGAPPASAPPPVQAATTHATAASEVPRMIASQRWRTPAAAGVGPGDPCCCNP